MSWQDRVCLAKATGAPFGVGNYSEGVLLLIGEQASDPGNAPEQLPFCSDKGCSAWLNKGLAAEGHAEDNFFWVNALNNDGTPVDLKKLTDHLKPLKTIALGNVAKKHCLEQGVAFEYVYHPQYWKRFKSKHRYPLWDLLQVIIMKAAYRLDARALTWEEKVASVERMRFASQQAKAAMKATLEII